MASQNGIRTRAGVGSALLVSLLALVHPFAPAGQTQQAKAAGATVQQSPGAPGHLAPGHLAPGHLALTIFLSVQASFCPAGRRPTFQAF